MAKASTPEVVLQLSAYEAAVLMQLIGWHVGGSSKARAALSGPESSIYRQLVSELGFVPSKDEHFRAEPMEKVPVLWLID